MKLIVVGHSRLDAVQAAVQVQWREAHTAMQAMGEELPPGHR